MLWVETGKFSRKITCPLFILEHDMGCLLSLSASCSHYPAMTIAVRALISRCVTMIEAAVFALSVKGSFGGSMV